MLIDEGTLVLIAGQELSDRIEIDAGGEVRAVTFTANGEYLVSDGPGGVRVWRVKDGERVATMKVEDGVHSLAVSKDGRFIAAELSNKVLVWDATTYKRIFAGRNGSEPIWDVDFSPNSARLVSADGGNHTATIWDITARTKVQTLDHGRSVYAAKYSPQGDRIATASWKSIRVWDSEDGRLLIDVKVGPSPLRGLLWFKNYLFVKTKDSKVKQIDASTGSAVSEWSVPHDDDSQIALPQHGQFLAYSTRDHITFWDTSTRIQLGLIFRSSYGRSIAFSSSGQRLALVQQRKIIIENVSRVKVRPHLNKFPFLICTSYTRSRTFILKKLRSTRGKTLNSPMRKHC